MPLIPLPLNAIIQLTFRSTIFNQRILNTFRYQFVGVPDPAVDYRQYFGAFSVQIGLAGGMLTKVAETYPTNCIMADYRIQTIFPQRQRYEQYLVGAAGQSSFGETETANVAASIRRVTDLIGPRGVGRVQIPAPTGARTSGLVDPGYVTGELGALADQLKLDVVTTTPDATWQPVLFGVTGGISHVSVVIGSEPEDTVRVMRRRTVRLGE